MITATPTCALCLYLDLSSPSAAGNALKLAIESIGSTTFSLSLPRQQVDQLPRPCKGNIIPAAMTVKAANALPTSWKIEIYQDKLPPIKRLPEGTE